MSAEATVQVGARAYLLRGRFEHRHLVAAIPGARWDQIARAWTLPRSPMTAQSILAIYPELSDALASEQEVRGDALRASATSLVEPLPWDTPLPPWRHQLQAARWLAAHDAALLQYGMGTGKTRAALDALRLIDARRVLVVCPLRVCRTWEREAALHHPGIFTVQRLDRASTKRKRWLMEEAISRARITGAPLLVAVNYESAWRPELADALANAGFEVVVFDEIHRLKGPGSRQSRFAARLALVAGRRWGLSGTPLAHSPSDAYGVFRSLDPGIFGTSFARFRSAYCVMGGYQNRQVVRYQNLREFKRRYDSITLAADRSVLDLPEALHQEVAVALPPEARRVHDEIRDEAVSELRSGGEVVATNVLTRLLRMQQVASGHVVVEVVVNDPDPQVLREELREVHTAKLEALVELLDDLDPTEPVVVFARFKHDIEQIHRAAAAARRVAYSLTGSRNDLETWERACDSWQGAVLAANIQSGGEGIDLTRARYCVYFDVPFSLAQYEQSLARVHRPGQTRSVAYYHLIATGTVDRYVRRVLKDRRDVIDEVLSDQSWSEAQDDNGEQENGGASE